MKGFYMMRSKSGRSERLAFRCKTCGISAVFAEDQTAGTVVHCGGKSEPFHFNWIQTTVLPRRSYGSRGGAAEGLWSLDSKPVRGGGVIFCRNFSPGDRDAPFRARPQMKKSDWRGKNGST